jgi:hypothetical protein
MNTFQGTARPDAPASTASGRGRATKAAALAVTLGIAGACWILSGI